jgi:hypothetical protein
MGNKTKHMKQTNKQTKINQVKEGFHQSIKQSSKIHPTK